MSLVNEKNEYKQKAPPRGQGPNAMAQDNQRGVHFAAGDSRGTLRPFWGYDFVSFLLLSGSAPSVLSSPNKDRRKLGHKFK